MTDILYVQRFLRELANDLDSGKIDCTALNISLGNVVQVITIEIAHKPAAIFEASK